MNRTAKRHGQCPRKRQGIVRNGILEVLQSPFDPVDTRSVFRHEAAGLGVLVTLGDDDVADRKPPIVMTNGGDQFALAAIDLLACDDVGAHSRIP